MYYITLLVNCLILEIKNEKTNSKIKNSHIHVHLYCSLVFKSKLKRLFFVGGGRNKVKLIQRSLFY